MKKNYFFILLFFIGNITFAQNYYYFKNQQIPLRVDKSGFDIYVNNTFQTASVANSNIEPLNLNISNADEKIGNIDFINNPTDLQYFAKINEVKSNGNVISVQPRFITEAGNILNLSNYVFVKLKKTGDLPILQTLATAKNFTIIGPNQFMPLWYKIKCTKNTLGNTLEISNYLSEVGYFGASNADFLSNYIDDEPIINTPTSNGSGTACANDTNFGDLWGLQNNVNPGIDIDICNAWTITEGANVKVAVLDTGIELTNLDLTSNILPISYNTVTGTSPSQTYGTHGTFVAGIIGSIKNNNYQVVGVVLLHNLN